MNERSFFLLILYMKMVFYTIISDFNTVLFVNRQRYTKLCKSKGDGNVVFINKTRHMKGISHFI
mgnify:FL=1